MWPRSALRWRPRSTGPRPSRWPRSRSRGSRRCAGVGQGGRHGRIGAAPSASGIGIATVLVALGGVLGLLGVRNPRRRVEASDCPAGSWWGNRATEPASLRATGMRAWWPRSAARPPLRRVGNRDDQVAAPVQADQNQLSVAIGVADLAARGVGPAGWRARSRPPPCRHSLRWRTGSPGGARRALEPPGGAPAGRPPARHGSAPVRRRR